MSTTTIYVPGDIIKSEHRALNDSVVTVSLKCTGCGKYDELHNGSFYQRLSGFDVVCPYRLELECNNCTGKQRGRLKVIEQSITEGDD